MRKRQQFQIAYAALLCCFVSVLAASPQQLKEAGGPRIGFDRQRHNFGHVKEGVHVRHVFKVLNSGGATLEIDKVIASCGCTVPTMKVKSIPPGKSADLEVVMDTTVKQGAVTKQVEIYSNDPATPEAIVYLTADVEDLHKSLPQSERGKIFLGKCGICHWKAGLGLEGEDLFKADCGMCHGDQAQGGIGPALAGKDYKDQDVLKHVKEVTSFGSSRHVSMPGFSQDAGGPLSDSEIDSIINYLSELSAKK